MCCCVVVVTDVVVCDHQPQVLSRNRTYHQLIDTRKFSRGSTEKKDTKTTRYLREPSRPGPNEPVPGDREKKGTRRWTSSGSHDSRGETTRPGTGTEEHQLLRGEGVESGRTRVVVRLTNLATVRRRVTDRHQHPQTDGSVDP